MKWSHFIHNLASNFIWKVVVFFFFSLVYFNSVKQCISLYLTTLKLNVNAEIKQVVRIAATNFGKLHERDMEMSGMVKWWKHSRSVEPRMCWLHPDIWWWSWIRHHGWPVTFHLMLSAIGSLLISSWRFQQRKLSDETEYKFGYFYKHFHL